MSNVTIRGCEVKQFSLCLPKTWIRDHKNVDQWGEQGRMYTILENKIWNILNVTKHSITEQKLVYSVSFLFRQKQHTHNESSIKFDNNNQDSQNKIIKTILSPLKCIYYPLIQLEFKKIISVFFVDDIVS